MLVFFTLSVISKLWIHWGETTLVVVSTEYDDLFC